MKVVLDTNILISGLLGKKAKRVIDLWLEERFDLIFSPEIIDEYLGVLRRPKFSLREGLIEKIIIYLFEIGVEVVPKRKIRVIRDDPSDNKFIATAIEGKADLIVSGDKHLLNLKQYRKIKIVSLKEFFEMF